LNGAGEFGYFAVFRGNVLAFVISSPIGIGSSKGISTIFIGTRRLLLGPPFSLANSENDVGKRNSFVCGKKHDAETEAF
jgi:hypothetical protein